MLECIFICIALLSMGLLYIGTGRNNKVLIGSIVWLLIVGIISYQGFFENTEIRPPRFLLIPVIVIPMMIFFYKKIDREKLKYEYLIGIHVLRLPIELILYQLFLRKEVPVLMTFKGWNFDILVGISALIILIVVLISGKKTMHHLILFWNITGLIFLIMIISIAVLSSPLPIQLFAFDQPNIAVLKFPFIYLPAYVVPVVFLSHILYIFKPGR